MRVRALFGVLSTAPVLMAAVPSIPIAGIWKADPSADLVGPNGLEISDRFVAFGPNREKITNWTKDRDTIRIDTSAGHSYSFRQEADSRVCLVTTMRPAATIGSNGAMPVRCYTKDDKARN